ncbi:3-demethylubiquinone-9 3-methyltransferase [compost metagenome]
MPLGDYEWAEKYGWLTDKYGVSWQFWLGKFEDVGQRLTAYLTFAGQQQGRAEEAINFYENIFKDARSESIVYYKSGDDANLTGKVKHAQMIFNGQRFMLMDSPEPLGFQFTEGVSLTVYCETQQEIDYYWEKLTQGGAESRCGWLKDKFGVSWQIIPTILSKIMSNPEKAGKAAQAFMQMQKFDIEKIVQASI